MTEQCFPRVDRGGESGRVRAGLWDGARLLEIPAPILSARTQELYVTNEDGSGGIHRLLRNIIGRWLMQQCRRPLTLQSLALE